MSDLRDLGLLVESELVLRGAERKTNRLRFNCPTPGHADDKASTDYDTAKAVWKCRTCPAGGGVVDLARLLGIESTQQRHSGFEYQSKTGTTLFRVVRLEPKGFFQQVPDGVAGWKNGLNGVIPVLFGLGEIYSSSMGQPVLILEGEKDVLTARKLGFVATTNPMGAGKWRDDYSEDLRGRNVVVIPDNDKAGLEHQGEVAESLHKTASRVRCLPPLPEVGKKGDLTDWVNNGGTRDELLQLIENASDYTPQQAAGSPFIQLSKVERKQVRWLMEGFVPYGSLTMLVGDPGVGKSFVACALTASTTMGKGNITTNTEPATVLFMSAEDSAEYVLGPRFDSMDADTTRIFIEEELPALDENGFQMLHEAVDTHRPRLVIIDPLTAYLGAATDMYRANEVREFTTRLSGLADRYGIAVVVVAHLNKGSGRKGIYRVAGSVDFVASARTVILAGGGRDSEAERGIIVVKSNYAETGVATGYEITDGAFSWTGDTDLAEEDLLSELSQVSTAPARTEAERFIRDTLLDGPVPSTVLEELAKEEGISIGTLKRAKRKLKVKSVRDGKGGDGGTGQWLCQLPEGSKEAQEVHAEVVEHVAPLENKTGASADGDDHLAGELTQLQFDVGGHVGSDADEDGDSGLSA